MGHRAVSRDGSRESMASCAEGQIPFAGRAVIVTKIKGSDFKIAYTMQIQKVNHMSTMFGGKMRRVPGTTSNDCSSTQRTAPDRGEQEFDLGGCACLHRRIADGKLGMNLACSPLEVTLTLVGVKFLSTGTGRPAAHMTGTSKTETVLVMDLKETPAD